MAEQQGQERGFAVVDEEQQREIARKGGENVPDKKRTFSQDPELAAEAGRKGGGARGQSADGQGQDGNRGRNQDGGQRGNQSGSNR
jgi:general stress protein YciG